MKFIHTSDWHLGQSLLGKSRQQEHQKFLDWLLQRIVIHEVDCLIVAGDIFDCGTPPGYAQKMYFDFLARLKNTCCRHCIVIGGNHDSPAVLNASRDILGFLGIHVFGRAEDECRNEVVLLDDVSGRAALMIAAVPFLRDRDVRISRAGESFDEKSRSLAEGIALHYQKVAAAAREIMREKETSVPLILTGHFYARGGSASESVRDIHVGNLGAINCDDLSRSCDYVALGHLHGYQIVDGRENVIYCGSPLPMSIDEAASTKYVVLGEINSELCLQKLEIPVFQRLKVFRGSIDDIEKEFASLAASGESGIWVEVQVVEEREILGLNDLVNGWGQNAAADVLAVKHIRKNSPGLHEQGAERRQLCELEPEEVFARRLELETDMPDEDRESMLMTFRELLENLDGSEESHENS
jgi:exonuclease SbcD